MTSRNQPRHRDHGQVRLRRVELFNLSLTVGTLRDVVDDLEGRVAHEEGGYVCFANAHLVETARAEPAVRAALNHAAVVLPDGAPVAWLARTVWSTPVPRIAGSDVFERLCSRSMAPSYRHFLVGASRETLSLLKAQVEQRYAGIDVVGCYAPPFAPRLEHYAEEVATEIRLAGANIVWVGLGAPKQELFMRRLSIICPDVLLLGVGAVFDFASGKKSRSPEWMQEYGLEWVHRLATEPRRLWRRYLITNSLFICHAIVLLVSRRVLRRRLLQRGR